MLGELYASQIHKTIVKEILKQDSLKNIEYSNNRKMSLKEEEN
mgnify:CR=1 FL=1